MSAPRQTSSVAGSPHSNPHDHSHRAPGVQSPHGRQSPSVTSNHGQFASDREHHAAQANPNGLERMLEKVAHHLASVERRIGRLEQSNADAASSYETHHHSSPANFAKRASIPNHAAPSTSRPAMGPPQAYSHSSAAHAQHQAADTSRYRNSMLYALGQSEELILKVVEENNRLRRRLDAAHREIQRLRSQTGDFSLPEGKRSKTRNGTPNTTAAFYMAGEEDEELPEPMQVIDTTPPNSSIPPSSNRVHVVYPEGYEPGKRRFSVSSESYHPETLSQPSVIRALPKTEEQFQILGKTLKENLLFRHLEKERIVDIARAMWEVQVAAGATVVRQGDDGDNMYVIEDGEFEVLYSDEVVATLGPGRSFGEHALMYNCPRNATVRAIRAARLWAIDRETFRRIIMQESIKRRARYQDFLLRVPLLQSLLDYERAKVADALEPVEFENGKVIIKQGSTDVDGFYIIENGTVSCTKEPDEPLNGDDAPAEAVEAIRLGPGDYFGELALLTNKPRAATVTAIGQVKLLRITKLHFDQVMGPCEHLLKRNTETYASYATLIRGEKQQRMSGSRPHSTDAGGDIDAEDADAVANAFANPVPLQPSSDQANKSRQEVLERAISSEEEYVTCLATLVEGYMKGVQSHSELKVSQQDIDTIFSNVPELYGIHTHFLTSLRSCQEQQQADLLFRVLSEFISQLQRYIPYVRCYYSSIVVRRRRRSVPSFAAFLKAVQGDDKEDIDALLDNVFRRVNHYGQLLLELLQTSPQGEPTHLLAQEARAVLKKLEDVRVSSAQVYVILQNIAGDIEYPSNPNREYIAEERMSIVGSEAEASLIDVYSFLFSDLLVCTTQIDTGSEKPKLAHRNTIPLDKATVTSHNNEGKLTIEWERPDASNESLTFQCTPSWQASIIRVVKSLKDTTNPAPASK